MIIIGLTGSIGMGKSETAKMFMAAGAPVFDADAVVRTLQAKGGKALPLIEAEFKGVIHNGVLDRQKLGGYVFGNAAALKKLEAIMHPMVQALRQAFLDQAEMTGSKVVVIDEPLLFEMGAQDKCDKIIVVHAPADVQRERVLARDGMTPEKFADILSKQLPSDEKIARADYTVETDKGLDHANAQVQNILKELRGY